MATGRKTGGRQKGTPNKRSTLAKRTQEIAETAVAEGKTPLEVMLANMRHYDKLAASAEKAIDELEPEAVQCLDVREQFKYLLAEVKKAAGLRELAQGCARDAAPFLHPKLAAINPPDGGKPITTADVSDQERAKVLLNFMVRTRVTLKQET